jgi:hypothetical protein
MRAGQGVWEETIHKLLGDDNPCDECLVKPSCRKSFTGGSACEKLAGALEKAIEVFNNENKT